MFKDYVKNGALLGSGFSLYVSATDPNMFNRPWGSFLIIQGAGIFLGSVFGAATYIGVKAFNFTTYCLDTLQGKNQNNEIQYANHGEFWEVVEQATYSREQSVQDREPTPLMNC